MQRAQPAVAVGLERAHAQLVGQGEGLEVVFSSLLVCWRSVMRCNGAEEAEAIRLRPTFLAPTALREHPFGTDLRLLHAARQQGDVASPDLDTRLEPCERRRSVRVLHLLQQDDGLVAAPG